VADVEVLGRRRDVEPRGQLADGSQIGQQLLARPAFASVLARHDVGDRAPVHGEHDWLAALHGGDHPGGVVSQLAYRDIHCGTA
jgi:hypothetical protein